MYALDSMNYILNKPNLKKGFKLYYNCDSIAFMKRIVGDTIEIYRKGGYRPLYYSSIYEFSSFKHYIANYDSTDGHYLSKFYEDGRIILEHPSHYILIIKNDSLFNYYVDDSQYLMAALSIDFELTQEKIDEKKQELRQKYSPKEKIRFYLSQRFV